MEEFCLGVPVHCGGRGHARRACRTQEPWRSGLCRVRRRPPLTADPVPKASARVAQVLRPGNRRKSLTPRDPGPRIKIATDERNDTG